MEEQKNIHNLTPFEVQAYVKELSEISLQNVGSSKWYKQHERLSRLNMEAHNQALECHDECVKDALISFDKIDLLIKELITTEFWKDKIFPLIQTELAELPSLQSYTPIYHEATLANLLEVTLYHRTAVDSAASTLIDLVEYIYRKLAFLVQNKEELINRRKKARDLSVEFSALDELVRQKHECELAICCCAVSLIQFLTDHSSGLPLSVVAHIMDEKDFLLLLIPLLHAEPWVLRKANGGVETFTANQWREVPTEEQGAVPKLTAQVWMSIYNLVMDSKFRDRYEVTYARRENLLQLRRYMNDSLHDQIAPLKDLHRFLEELAIQGSFPVSSAPTPIIVAVVAEIREGLEKKYAGRCSDLAKEQLKTNFVADSSKTAHLAKLFASMEYEGDSYCAACGVQAKLRCSRCQYEWYCSQTCQRTHWETHKSLCTSLNNARKNLTNLKREQQ